MARRHDLAHRDTVQSSDWNANPHTVSAPGCWLREGKDGGRGIDPRPPVKGQSNIKILFFFALRHQGLIFQNT